jgi:putative two-component system response regulator
MHTKKTVVIVDDNIVNLRIGLNALKSDYHVSTFPSGKKLFQFLDKITPDLILLDIDMPEMNGFEVLERLKNNPQTAEIPVVFLTSNDSLEFEMKGFNMGAVDYMHKPYYAPFLLKRLAMHFQIYAMDKKNREIEEKLQTNQKALADLQMRLLKTIIELVERRDEVSGGHVERTRKYVEVLLDVLEKNNIYSDVIASWEKELVLHSTMLYDLGKLSIHDTILLKPDKLEDDEYSAIKKHPAIGVQIIDDIRIQLATDSNEANMLNYAKEFAGFHHEKWDGTGYPNGLKGYNIPLPGRLMAIADVYDALISKRTYKKTYTHEEAAAIISQGKGSHFDPILVDAFISEADKFRNISGQGVLAL